MRDNGIEGAPAQSKLLDVILDMQEHGERVPTYQDLAEIVCTARSQVQVGIKALIKKGYLKSGTTPSKHIKTGTIEPTEKAWTWRSSSRKPSAPSLSLLEEGDTLRIQVMGTVAAGGPREVSGGGSEEYLSLPAQHVRGSDVFLLEVAGDSMAGDGLRGGDHIIVDPHARWDDGDMVVVLDQGAATVKRLFRQGASILLEPSNKDHKAIILRPGREHVGGQIIQGKVIGLVLWHIDPGHGGNGGGSQERG
jgi:repressor LexA